MVPRPLVLLSSDQKQIGDALWHATPSTYVEAVIFGAAAMPVLLPSMAGALDLDAILDRVDGVVLTGARSNVHPELYDEAETPEHAPFDAARDATTLPLARRAIERDVPLLAICRGFQELNVALGGSLHAEIQTFEGRMDHRAPEAPTEDSRYAIRHPVRLTQDGGLARLIGAEEVAVNSLHHQGLARLAPGLVVEATAPDGTIEAVRVEWATTFAYGVQWHPEYWVRSDAPSARIFAAFGEAVREHAAAR